MATTVTNFCQSDSPIMVNRAIIRKHPGIDSYIDMTFQVFLGFAVDVHFSKYEHRVIALGNLVISILLQSRMIPNYDSESSLRNHKSNRG
jgi:hypothetical protein